MAEPVNLELRSETKLDPSVHNGLLTYNPSIELFASASGPKTLQIQRSNGQIVVKGSQKGEKESVEALRWKPDGEFLAVGWSDGVVRLMGLENSKAVHQIPVCEAGKVKITWIGWTRNHAGKRRTTLEPDATPWNDLSLEGLSLNDNKKAAPDLPTELTFLEVETALPKLSPLPASGGTGDDMYVFTTRASLDFLFRPFSSDSSDSVDVMLVGTNDGRVHISIYDSFVIGNFQYKLPGDLGPEKPLSLLRHASHPYITTHSLLFGHLLEGNRHEMYLVPMDLTIIHSSPENLSLLASKTTTLQKLLRYIKQVETHMIYEWQSTRELPGRFLNNINETLREAGTYGDMDIGKAMYHSVVTGHSFPEVKEWLVDQLQERGHKRWDKAVVSGLEGLRSLVHENFLPALERTAIILSRLLGIARYHDSDDGIGFTSIQISKIMDVVSCMMLVGNKILLLAMEELDLFHSFSSWLRYEIDRLATSSVSDELTEKEATMEHGKILTYIQYYMPGSSLRYYLSKVSDEEWSRDAPLAEDVTSLLDMLDKQVIKQEAGQSQSHVISQVQFLGQSLFSKSASLFKGIAEAEKRSVRFGQPTRIELEHKVSASDVQMCTSKEESDTDGITYAAFAMESRENQLYIFRTHTQIINGISGSSTTQQSCLNLGDAKVLDLQFLNEESLLVLLLLQGRPRIIRVPHQSTELGYQDYAPGTPTSPHEMSTEQVVSIFPNMLIGTETNFLPVQMEVMESSSERGQFPARVCLLGSDRQTYKIFELPIHLC